MLFSFIVIEIPIKCVVVFFCQSHLPPSYMLSGCSLTFFPFTLRSHVSVSEMQLKFS